MDKQLKQIISTFLMIVLCFIIQPAAVFGQPVYATHSVLVQPYGMVNFYSTFAFLRWLFDRMPKDEDRPANTDSAGRRGKCNEVSETFVGFIPSLEDPMNTENGGGAAREVKSYLGFTTNAFPILWFYTPELPNDVNTLELMIQDERGIDVLDTPTVIPISQSAGIRGIDLSVTAIPLELNKPYHWYLSIICNEERPSRNPSIDAWVEQVTLSADMEQQLSSITDSLEQAQLYIENGIWHDALTLVATRRWQNPEQQEDWTSLLQSIGIKPEIANAPILEYPD